MKYFTKLAKRKKPIQEAYAESKKGLVYVAPTGSGKTRVALRATKGTPTTVIGTASLQQNFDKEELKAFKTTSKNRTNFTYAKVSRGADLPGGKHLVLDESQYIRNPSSKTLTTLKRERPEYDKALLLSATPMYNEPADIASQVNLVAGAKKVPTGRDFYKTFYKEKKVSPGLIGSLIGVKPGASRTLKSKKLPKKYMKDYVYVEDAAKFKDLMPKRDHEQIKIPMAKEQVHIYKYLSRKAPLSVRYKVKRDLPPSKTEARSMNAFLSGMRQASNTTAPFVKDKTTAVSPKMDRMVSDLQTELKAGGKVLTYSNFIGSGVTPYTKRLDKAKIPYAKLTGEMSKAERELQVKKYNTKNKTNVFVYSGAGAEGLNLPKTTMVQLMEPHWNKAKTTQAESRGIRRGDDPSRTVDIKEYISVFPHNKRKKTSDQYLAGMSDRKRTEIAHMLKALK